MFDGELLHPGKVDRQKVSLLRGISSFRIRFHYKEFVTEEADIDDISFTIFHDKTKGKLVIYFKGSDSFTDWERYNLRAGHKEISMSDTTVLCHAGFLNAWNNVEPRILDYLTSNKKTISQILFIGHSLGGAVATIGYLKLPEIMSASIVDNKVGLVTFGAPCSVAYPHSVRLSGESTIYNIINLEDPVPLLPVWFRVPGNRIYLETMKMKPASEGLKNVIIKENKSLCMWLKYFTHKKDWSSHDMSAYDFWCNLL